MTRAHLTPSLFTIGPPMKQAESLAKGIFWLLEYILEASMAYLSAVAMLDT